VSAASAFRFEHACKQRSAVIPIETWPRPLFSHRALHFFYQVSSSRWGHFILLLPAFARSPSFGALECTDTVGRAPAGRTAITAVLVCAVFAKVRGAACAVFASRDAIEIV
jgi:hypothetical protein